MRSLDKIGSLLSTSLSIGLKDKVRWLLFIRIFPLSFSFTVLRTWYGYHMTIHVRLFLSHLSMVVVIFKFSNLMFFYSLQYEIVNIPSDVLNTFYKELNGGTVLNYKFLLLSSRSTYNQTSIGFSIPSFHF